MVALKTFLNDDTKKVKKKFYSNNIKTVQESSTTMILKSLKRFLNDGTKKFHINDTKKSFTMMVLKGLKRFLNNVTEEVP